MKKSIYFFLFFLSLISCESDLVSQQEKIVQEQLDAYNERNIDRFMAVFSADPVVLNYPGDQVLARGRSATRALYKELFDNSPDLHSRLINRTVIGQKVLDQERITGRNGNPEAIELVVIYEIKNGKIDRCMVIR